MISENVRTVSARTPNDVAATFTLKRLRFRIANDRAATNGTTKSAPSGLNVTSEYAAGSMKLNPMMSRNMSTVPASTYTYVVLAGPCSLRIFRSKRYIPPKTAARLKSPNNTIPGPTTGVATAGPDISVERTMAENVRGVRTTADVKSADGMRAYRYQCGNVYVASGKTMNNLSKKKACITAIKSTARSDQSV